MWSQADPNTILWFWWGCDCETEVQKFTAGALLQTNGLRALLDLAVVLVRSSAGKYEQVSPQSARIVDLKALEIGARRLSEESASSEDQTLAQRFLTALTKKILIEGVCERGA